MKRKIFAGVLMILTLLFSGCRTAHVPSAKSTLTIDAATDFHYLSPSLTDYGPDFIGMLERGDGKLSEKSPEITDAFLAKVRQQKPDALILCGDLTFDGELQSLKDMKKKLQQVQKEGIPVLVVPGNHDINYPFAYRYKGSKAYRVDNISHAQFTDEMKEFGYNDALSKDSESFSYMYELSKDLWILAIDCNPDDLSRTGEVKEETLQWMEKQLKNASEKGVKVISFSHQNVLPQSSFMSDGFVMENADKVRALLEKYGVILHLSGHSHLQHETSQDGLHEVCTGSITVSPERYGIVHVENGQAQYTMESVGYDLDEAQQRFADTVRRQVQSTFKNLSLSEEEKNVMTDFAVRANQAYFAGDINPDDFIHEEGWTLWKEKGTSSFWYSYMRSFLEQ